MQLHYFPNDDFVIHRALGRNVSAWFDGAGNVLDAELRDRMGRHRPVKPSGPMWRELERLGRIHRRHEANVC